MAAEIDATIAQRMNMSFADQGEVFRAQQNRATAGDAAVAELVRNGAAALTSVTLAKATQTLLTDLLSQQILGQRSVRDQPASTPFANPSTAK